MSSITVRRIGEALEEEARRILQAGVGRVKPRFDNVADAIRRIVDPIGGVEIESLPRGTLRDIPCFDGEDDEP